jgi:branched-chain amino acid transport system substrate-binding protein
MVRAVNEVGLKTRMFGGGMVGPQFAALKTALGPMLNGVVNYELYAPELTGKFPFLEKFLAKYQERAAKEGVDPLGYYLPPYAYAMMQVLDQAITATKGLDQAKLAEYIHKNTFDTFVGKVNFAKNGEWAVPRVMMVQFHGIQGNSVDQWKKPGVLTVLEPAAYKTGTAKTPFQDARK